MRCGEILGGDIDGADQCKYATGSLEEIRRTLLEALELGGDSRELRARVEQNLGIVANILTLSSVDSFWQNAVFGGIILAALVLTKLTGSRGGAR